MQNAKFTNFTDQDFIGHWDGKAKKIKAGQSIYMPDYLAKHFAKHLVNRELLRKDDNGNLIYKDGEKYTSPKKPEEVPTYMKLFEKAYEPDEDTDEDDMTSPTDDPEALIKAQNKNKQSQKPQEEVSSNLPDTEEKTEEEFEGSPEEDNK